MKYLESKLFEMAKAAKRYTIANSSTPTCPAISESEQAVMTEFISNLRMLINTLGYKVLEPFADRAERQKDLYFIKSARGANGKAVVTNEGVIYTEGTNVSIENTIVAFNDNGPYHSPVYCGLSISDISCSISRDLPTFYLDIIYRFELCINAEVPVGLNRGLQELLVVRIDISWSCRTVYSVDQLIEHLSLIQIDSATTDDSPCNEDVTVTAEF